MNSGKKIIVLKISGVFWKRSDFNTGKKIRVWKFEGGDSGIGRIWIQERNLEFGNWEVGCSGIGRIWIQEKKFRAWKFGEGETGVFWKVKIQSAKIWLNFHFWRGGALEPNSRIGVF